MKSNCRLFGLPALGLGLLLLTCSCNATRERDITHQRELRRENTELASVPPTNKMLVRTRDGVQLVDDFSTTANRAFARQWVEKQREAKRHKAMAMKGQHLLR